MIETAQKYLAIGFLSAVVVELFSLISAAYPILQPIFYIAVIATIFYFTLKKPMYGVIAAMVELAIGGKGYLLALATPHGTLSLRMGIFAILLIAWVIFKIKNQKLKIKKVSFSSELIISLFFLTFVGWGIVNGFINNPTTVFSDANAWLYFAIVGVFITSVNRENISSILAGIAGATTWLAIKTIGLFILFSKGFAVLHGFTYNWLRDTGVGEVTQMTPTMFRIFFQSHLYLAIVFIWCCATLVISKNELTSKKWLTMSTLYLTSLALLISQSRSIWIATGTTLICLVLFGIIKKTTNLKKIGLLFSTFVLFFATQFLFIGLTTGNYSAGILGGRFSHLEADPASSSRSNELAPLVVGITKHPFFGSGFGKTLTYVSNDPRIREHNPSGLYTTDAFEWGYLDIALKIGIVGLLVYGAIIFTLISNLSAKGGSASGEKSQISNLIPTLLVSGVGILVITNIFTPYLNHPLGIGYVLLVISFVWQTKNAPTERAHHI